MARAPANWLSWATIWITLAMGGFPQDGVAQDPFYQVADLEVAKGATQMAFGFSGGFNTPQFSPIDFDSDGRLDLFVFDRSGNKALAFVNVGSTGVDSLKHAPQFQDGFPQMTDWALLRDINCDGLPDLFTGNETRISYYNAISPGEFQKVTDTLRYTQSTLVKDFFVNQLDVPGIADINGDGDLDILTFAPAGGFIEYYENQSIENVGDCSEPSFEFIDKCWGDVYESGFRKSVQLDTCAPGLLGGSRHSGSTVCVLDMNGDNIMEVILGDLNFSNLVMLSNDGTNTNAHIYAQDTAFPVNSLSVELPQFPAAFFLDTDNDSIRDLIVAPNAKNISADVANTWFYLNTGTDSSPAFEFQTNDWLARHAIDVGRYSAPVFFDHNADGLNDIVIGNFSRSRLVGSDPAFLTLYENVGTAQVPAFQYVTEDYANLSALSDFYGLVPTFGDLDDDQDEDMILGEEDGRLYYFVNTAGAGNTAQYALAKPFMDSIDVGAFSTPQLVDVDRDDDLDLVIGERNGILNYYPNLGTKSSPLFDKDSFIDQWGDVNVTLPNSLIGYSYPYLYEDDATSEYALLVGSEHGHIFHFTDIEGNLSGAFTLVDTMLDAIDPGERATISGGLLNDDDKVELLVGNFRGGAELFTRSIVTLTPGTDRVDCHVFPNPASEVIRISCDDAPTQIYLYDLQGRLLLSTDSSTLSVGALQSGLYYVSARINTSQTVTQPVVVLH